MCKNYYSIFKKKFKIQNGTCPLLTLGLSIVVGLQALLRAIYVSKWQHSFTTNNTSMTSGRARNGKSFNVGTHT